MSSLLQLFAAGFVLSSLVRAQSAIFLSITPKPTSGASGIISPSFAGFGIEPSNLYSFTGGSTNNDLTTNLISNLANYTGAPPHLRIGGNTEDYMIYEASMNDYVVEQNPNPTGQGAFASDSEIIGPRFFEVINRTFPSNTPITFGLNLAYEESDYIDRITAMAKQALTLTKLNLVSFEIGNEPDLYLQNAFRTGSWGGQVYTQQWLDRANAIWEQVLKPNGMRSNFFEPGCTASTIGTSFEIQDLDSTFGIAVDANGSSNSYVSSWNQHDYYYYIGVSTYALTQYEFLTLSTTNDQFASWVTQIQQAENTPYPYALREMGVVGPIGMHGITDVFGAALWTLNFFFYAASLNISSVQMHMTDNSNASAWQPIEYYGNQPFVRPNYYAWAAFDQTIGPTCQAQVGGYILTNQPTQYAGRSAAYSVYQDGTLASIVLINSYPANISDSKGTLPFDLSIGTQFAGQTLYLAYLTNDGADAYHGTTWNGISYEQSGDGTPTRVNSTVETVTVGSDGSVTINVRDTQAVVANIGSPVGSRTLNQSACSKLASATPDAKPVATPVGTSTANAAASSNAATSMRSGSTTASGASATSTSGVAGLSNLIVAALTSTSFLFTLVLLCI